MADKGVSVPVRVAILVVPPFLAILVTFLILRNMLFLPVDANQEEIVRLEIAQGKGFSQIAADLKERDLIRSVFGLKVLARLKNSGGTIKAGEYELSASMTPRDILKKLVSGDVVKRKVLVKEGATIWDIANSLDQAGVITKDEFLSASTDKTFLDKAGIQGPSFEGYLFPETYFFSRPISPHDVIWTMFEEGEKHWTEEFSNQLDKLMLTRHDLLTLASIIEKESGNFEEMPLVSSVFHNRLRDGMKLQSDPTVIYGITNFNGNITKADLENPHPYNTYTRPGLPPGPIANPSENAVRAALFPRTTNYYYFVADGKGRHIFSSNLKDHNEAVNQYQRNRKDSALPPIPGAITAPIDPVP